MRQKQGFTVKFLCKPYVARYLEQNFGTPADISSDKQLLRIVRDRLKKPCFHYDSKYPTFGAHTEEVTLLLGMDDMTRYGTFLSKTDMIQIGQVIETRVKAFCRTWLSVNRGMGFALSKLIEDFQERFDYPEEVWPKSSIMKDYQRNSDPVKFDFESIAARVDDLILCSLHKQGALTTKAVTEFKSQKSENIYQKRGEVVRRKDTTPITQCNEKALF